MYFLVHISFIIILRKWIKKINIAFLKWRKDKYLPKVKIEGKISKGNYWKMIQKIKLISSDPLSYLWKFDQRQAWKCVPQAPPKI